jgi:hypothetical protein
MAESDEFSPLIQRHVTASAAELRAEAAAVKLELTAALKDETSALKDALKGETSALRSEMQEMNQRSMRMGAQLQVCVLGEGGMVCVYPNPDCRTSSPAPVLLDLLHITMMPLQHDCWQALLHITTMPIKLDRVANDFVCDTCDLCVWRIIP